MQPQPDPRLAGAAEAAAAAARAVPVRAADGRVLFQVQPGQTLLAAAEQVALPWPASCRNGTCRTCVQRLAQDARGAVRYRVEWPGLLAEEKAAGWVLPCVAEPAGAALVLHPDTRADHQLPVV